LLLHSLFWSELHLDLYLDIDLYRAKRKFAALNFPRQRSKVCPVKVGWRKLGELETGAGEVVGVGCRGEDRNGVKC
jgi:hypothetical protein